MAYRRSVRTHVLSTSWSIVLRSSIAENHSLHGFWWNMSSETNHKPNSRTSSCKLSGLFVSRFPEDFSVLGGDVPSPGTMKPSSYPPSGARIRSISSALYASRAACTGFKGGTASTPAVPCKGSLGTRNSLESCHSAQITQLKHSGTCTFQAILLPATPAPASTACSSRPASAASFSLVTVWCALNK